jgi:hypothetical protein
MPFPYLPMAKQVAEYRAVAAPILKPPIPTFTTQKKNHVLVKFINRRI